MNENENVNPNISDNTDNVSHSEQNAVAPANVPAPPLPATKKAHIVAPFQMRDRIFLPIVFVMSLLISELALFGNFMAGFTAVYLLFFAVSAAYLGKAKNKVTLYPILCGLLSCVTSVVFSVSADSDMRMISLFATASLFAVWVFSVWGSPRHDTGSYMTVFDILRYIVVVPLSNLLKPFSSMNAREGKKNGKGAKVFLGLVISLPLVCVVVPLLVSSDAAFEGLISGFWSNLGRFFGHLIFGIILFPLCLSFLFAIRKDFDKKEAEDNEDAFRILDGTVVNTVLCVVSLVYGVYLFSQLGYFFSAFAKLLPEDFTVAQYARRGFFELCAIAAINLAIVAVSLIMSKKREGKLSVLTKSLDLFLGVFTLVLIATAMSKMWLYIGSLGMTRLRILTSCFMLVLAVIFVCVMLRIFIPRFAYMRIIAVVASVAVLVISFADIDTVVARYNVRAYQTGKLESVDMETLWQLGSGSTPYIIELLDDEDEDIRAISNEILCGRAEQYFDIYNGFESIGDDSLKNFNLAKYRERKALSAVLDRLDTSAYVYNFSAVDDFEQSEGGLTADEEYTQPESNVEEQTDETQVLDEYNTDLNAVG